MCVFLLATSVLASAILAMTIWITILGKICKKWKIIEILGLKYFSRSIGDNYLEITWCEMVFMYSYVQMSVIGLMAMHVWEVTIALSIFCGQRASWKFFPLGDHRDDLFTAAPQGPSVHRSSWWQF